MLIFQLFIKDFKKQRKIQKWLNKDEFVDSGM